MVEHTSPRSSAHPSKSIILHTALVVCYTNTGVFASKTKNSTTKEHHSRYRHDEVQTKNTGCTTFQRSGLGLSNAELYCGWSKGSTQKTYFQHLIYSMNAEFLYFIHALWVLTMPKKEDLCLKANRRHVTERYNGIFLKEPRMSVHSLSTPVPVVLSREAWCCRMAYSTTLALVFDWGLGSITRRSRKYWYRSPGMGVVIGVGGLSPQTYHPYMGNWAWRSIQPWLSPRSSICQRRCTSQRRSSSSHAVAPNRARATRVLRVRIGNCRIECLLVLTRTRSLPGHHAYMSVSSWFPPLLLLPFPPFQTITAPSLTCMFAALLRALSRW